MNKAILMMSMILCSATALADIRWQISNDAIGERVAKIDGFSIQGKQLIILTVDSSYFIRREAIEATGLSMKELLDLLKEYDASENKTLYFNASKSRKGTLFIDSIASLVVTYKN